MSSEPLDDDATHERLAKARRLRERGIDPFPHILGGERTPIAELHERHDPATLAAGEHPQLRYRLAGRLIARRGHGRTAFLDLRDASGQIQLAVRQDALGAEDYERVLDLDIGDILEVEGPLYVTQRGQIALGVHRFCLLTKALRPPPAKYHGLEDAGTRYRYRELDLLANESTRELFLIRSRTIDALRAFLSERGFVEIETPVLQALAGGASARPFLTHHNALDQEMSLRISVELYLNRCLIGGLENVYDLGKCFRNEGISYRHSPEFTMLEWLMAYADHTAVARFTEEMVAFVAQRVLGTTTIERGGETIDLSKTWRATTMQAEIERVTGVDFLAAGRDELAVLLKDRVHPDATWAQVVQSVYSKLVEPTLNSPTMVYGFPLDSFPITKADADDPRLAEHFDAVIGGIELVSGDSEVTDPVEQWERFVAQRRERRAEEDDAPHPHDEEYVRALEYGLAPSASGGMGVDRLLMLLTGAETLREVATFPVMRELRRAPA
ncbi:MAG TPA: lysine--tRNA ligase [Solirubrobacteraceae bacterium]|jgi:lysyl-tRNA synthetase class 2|nr:lysine--tRNA ligase [Solirubrobacteraceae bacterium]